MSEDFLLILAFFHEPKNEGVAPQRASGFVDADRSSFYA